MRLKKILIKIPGNLILLTIGQGLPDNRQMKEGSIRNYKNPWSLEFYKI